MKPSYYSVLTAEARYDKRLSPSAKLLYSEITALCNRDGYCVARDEYFAKLYGRGEEGEESAARSLRCVRTG